MLTVWFRLSSQYLVLGWCKSQRDLEVVMKVLSQVCQAYRMDGGTTVVVMTQRAKLEMEQTFRCECVVYHSLLLLLSSLLCKPRLNMLIPICS